MSQDPHSLWFSALDTRRRNDPKTAILFETELQKLCIFYTGKNRTGLSLLLMIYKDLQRLVQPRTVHPSTNRKVETIVEIVKARYCPDIFQRRRETHPYEAQKDFEKLNVEIKILYTQKYENQSRHYAKTQARMK